MSRNRNLVSAVSKVDFVFTTFKGKKACSSAAKLKNHLEEVYVRKTLLIFPIPFFLSYRADLVPVFSFGENDIYEQLSNEKGTRIYAIQKKFQAIFGFTLPLFHGRGIFNYSVGLMPYRHPIVCVVGRPIKVTQNPIPTKSEIEEVQARYIEELTL